MKKIYILQPFLNMNSKDFFKIRGEAIKEIDSYVKKNCDEDVMVMNSFLEGSPKYIDNQEFYKIVSVLCDASDSDMLFLAGDWKNDEVCLSIKQAIAAEGIKIINES